MSNFSFTEDAFAEYIYWQTQDRKTLKKINALLNDINRHPFEGLGKPEPLKGNYKGFWSRASTTPTASSIASPMTIRNHSVQRPLQRLTTTSHKQTSPASEVR